MAAKTSAKDDRELAQVQAETIEDDVKKANYRYEKNGDAFVTVADKEFKLAEELSLMAAAKMSLMQDDDEEMDLEALYLLMQSIIADEDWKKFERFVITKRVSAEDLIGVIAGGLEAISGRPTGEPSGS